MCLGGCLSFSLAGIFKMPVPWSQCSNKTKRISSPCLGRAPRAALMRHLAEEVGRGCLCFNANLTECEDQVSAASLVFRMASWLQSAWKGEEERAEMIVELYEGFFFFPTSFKNMIITRAAFPFLQHFAFLAREPHCCCHFST